MTQYSEASGTSSSWTSCATAVQAGPSSPPALRLSALQLHTPTPAAPQVKLEPAEPAAVGAAATQFGGDQQQQQQQQQPAAIKTEAIEEREQHSQPTAIAAGAGAAAQHSASFHQQPPPVRRQQPAARRTITHRTLVSQSYGISWSMLLGLSAVSNRRTLGIFAQLAIC